MRYEKVSTLPAAKDTRTFVLRYRTRRAFGAAFSQKETEKKFCHRSGVVRGKLRKKCFHYATLLVILVLYFHNARTCKSFRKSKCYTIQSQEELSLVTFYYQQNYHKWLRVSAIRHGKNFDKAPLYYSHWWSYCSKQSCNIPRRRMRQKSKLHSFIQTALPVYRLFFVLL